MNNMGGSIGLGMPLATGASVACPDRKVICLEGDGSGMYTLQALWTMKRTPTAEGKRLYGRRYRSYDEFTVEREIS